MHTLYMVIDRERDEEINSTSKDVGGKSTQFSKDYKREKVVKFSSIRFGVASSPAIEKICGKSTMFQNFVEKKKVIKFGNKFRCHRVH